MAHVSGQFMASRFLPLAPYRVLFDRGHLHIYVSRAKCTKHVMGRKGRSVCPTCRRSENAYNNEVYSCNKEMLMILYMIR